MIAKDLRRYGALCPPWDIMPWLLRVWDISAIVGRERTIEHVVRSWTGLLDRAATKGRLVRDWSLDLRRACSGIQPEG